MLLRFYLLLRGEVFCLFVCLFVFLNRPPVSSAPLVFKSEIREYIL